MSIQTKFSPFTAWEERARVAKLKDAIDPEFYPHTTRIPPHSYRRSRAHAMVLLWGAARGTCGDLLGSVGTIANNPYTCTYSEI